MTLTVSENNSSNSSIRLMDNTSGPVAAPLVDALPTSEQSLLAKLEAANKLIESDAKSLNSLQSSAHSRKSSDTSQISLNSGKCHAIMSIHFAIAYFRILVNVNVHFIVVL